ncbi:MAG: helix-turn-helix transcriptional regulator [Firmicutes bacterium]|nr:helix-turn-helix transcriptional regulator [Bacillota bacterium]
MSKKVYLKDLENSSMDFPYNIMYGEITEDYFVHSHDFYEIFIILGGKAVHIVDGISYRIGAGDVYVITDSTVSHGFREVNHLLICNIMFKDNTLFSRFPDLRKLAGFQALFILEPYYREAHQFKSRLHLDYFSLKYVMTIINEINMEFSKKEDGYQSMFISCLIKLIVYLSRLYTKILSTSNTSFFDIATVVSYIESNFSEKINITKLAKMACLSRRHFCRVFKNSYNISPHNFILKLRIEKACSLLKQTEMNIMEISMEAGFNDSSYFARQFKSFTGMTPTSYRKLHTHIGQE